MTSLVLLAFHNNGCQIIKYLSRQKDAKIQSVITYQDQPHQWWQSVSQLCHQLQLPVTIYQNDDQIYRHLRQLQHDWLLSISWRHLIPKSILSLPKKGAVNFHNSLLPQHRGVYANIWPILAGQSKTGVTLHLITAKIDHGAIIAQQEIPIHPWDTAREVWTRLNKAYLNLFKKQWPKVSQWPSLAVPQSGKGEYHSKSDFNKIKPINLNQKIRCGKFINYLRAMSFSPYYHNAYFIDPKTHKKIYISLSLSIDPYDA